MGGTMIKNLIIIALITIIVTQTDIGFTDILNYVQIGLDKVQEIVYSIRSEVK
jgi:hypothetical protein